jgi:hypothetical protein
MFESCLDCWVLCPSFSSLPSPARARAANLLDDIKSDFFASFFTPTFMNTFKALQEYLVKNMIKMKTWEVRIRAVETFVPLCHAARKNLTSNPQNETREIKTMKFPLLKAFALSILVPVATAHSLVGDEAVVLKDQANLRGADIGELAVRYP